MLFWLVISPEPTVLVCKVGQCQYQGDIVRMKVLKTGKVPEVASETWQVLPVATTTGTAIVIAFIAT